MRAGLTAPLWRRLAYAAPCYCTSPCYGNVLRALKCNTYPLWPRHLKGGLLPCCSTALQQNSLLHTTAPAHRTRRFFFDVEPKDTVSNNSLQDTVSNKSLRDTVSNNSLKRPKNFRSSLGRDDEELSKRLEMVKQATAFLKRAEAPTQIEPPPAPVTSKLSTSQMHSFSDRTSSTTSFESHNASPKVRNFDDEGKYQKFSSDSPSRNTSKTNHFSSEHQAGDDVNPRGNVFRNLGEKNSEHKEGKESDIENDLSADRLRFRRRYSRNRFYRDAKATPNISASTIKKIEEASHLLRHGTLPSNPEQSNTREGRKYFLQDSSAKETTPDVEGDSKVGASFRREQGSRAMKRLQTPDTSVSSLDSNESSETGGKMKLSPSTLSLQDELSPINNEPTNTSSSPESVREASRAAASTSYSPRPLPRSVALPTPYARQVPRTGAEQLELMKAPVVSPPNSRILRVALLGLPNSGKSTLVNALLEDRVCSVSNKANTTRCLARAIYTTDDTQLVFLDTPGVVTPEQSIKHRLFGSVVQDAERSLAQADLLLLLHDCSNPFNRLGLHPRLLRVLALYPHIPAVLVMNKVDLVKPKQHLLKMTRLLTDGVVGGRSSHEASPLTAPRDPFRDVKQDPDFLVKNFIDSLERSKSVAEGAEEELHSDELLDEELEATQQTHQVSFDRLVSGNGPVVLPNLDALSDFSVKASMSDEDVLSGRVKLSEQQLAAFIKDRKGWPYFQRVLLTSALTGDGVTDLRQVLEDSAVPGPWEYPPSMVTDQDPYQLATLTVREKFMDKFRYQLPYNLRFEVDNWELGDADSLIIRIRVICQEKGLVKYLVGANGCHIKALSQQAEQKLGQIFKSDVRLQLIVSSEDDEPLQTDETPRNRSKAREQA